MAYKAALVKLKNDNQERAVSSHLKFVQYVTGKVEKIGLEEVLKQERSGEYFWLKQQLNRVLDFAEQIQLKMIPQKLEGDMTHFVQMGEIKKEADPLRFDIGDVDFTKDPGYSAEAPASN